MKATIKFKLPDEHYEHEAAIHGTDSLELLGELLNEILEAIKYRSGIFANLDIKTLDEVSSYIHNNIVEKGLPNPCL